MSIYISVAPTIEPISLEIAKEHLRVTSTDDNDYITTLIKTVRKFLEGYTKRAFITQTQIYRFKDFPNNDSLPVYLPNAPLQSITSVQYIDTDGTTETWSTDYYTTDIYSTEGNFYPSYGYTYPSVQDILNAVTVTYICGFGDDAADVPEDLRHAMLIMIHHWYVNRMPVSDISKNEVPHSAFALARPFCIERFA